MELIPLGTSSATIVQDRGLSAYVLRSRGKVLLFDCGDGTQFRLLKAGIRRSRIRAIFISHLHGDHYLGLFGLLISMSLERREPPLTIVAPRELIDIIGAIPGLRPGEIHFQIQYVVLEEDCKSQEVYRGHGLQVRAAPLDHGRFCVGYRVEKIDGPNQIDGVLAHAHGIDQQEQFQRLAAGHTIQLPDGRTVSPDQVKKRSRGAFAYVTDTRPCEGGLDLAGNADLLVHDATFSQEDTERASSTGHSTARDAALLAKTAGAGKLLLTHFSARYLDVTLLRQEAIAVFSNTEIAEEYREYSIDFEGARSQTDSPNE
ncbi:MAG: ribonuclease Z [Bacteroidetes bacterium]|nr:ribonuclease Z [Bacteroidota bacterium]